MDTWKDEAKLREWYHSKGLSLAEIADKVGVSKQTVANNMEKLGVERRSATAHTKQSPAYHGFNERGYELVKSGQKYAYVHQLIAIANGTSPEYIFNGADVHHLNGITWDNRPENLEVHGHGEHRSIHEGYVDEPWQDKDWLQTEYLEKERSINDIATEFGVSDSTIHERLIKYDIPRRKKWEHFN